METQKATRKRKWWNNGWISLLVLFLSFTVLFLIGKYSPTYEPNPTIDGRLLSEWTGDLASAGGHDVAHSGAVDVLRAHRSEVTPVLIKWLGKRDTFPQTIYFGTMTILEGKTGHLLDYRGAYFNQLEAARAFMYMGDKDPKIIRALEGVVVQYQGTGHYAGEVASEALQKLRD